MRKKYLKIKTWIIHFLIKAGLIKNVWHPCEIELAGIRAEKLMQLFDQTGTSARTKYNIKQPVSRAGYKRGQRR